MYTVYGCRCEPCRLANCSYVQKRRLKQRKKDDSRAKQYGITRDGLYALARKQHWLCAICNVKFPKNLKGTHIDHCHKTRRVRGLLCNNCNSGLGLLKDDPNMLARGIRYLNGELPEILPPKPKFIFRALLVRRKRKESQPNA